MARAKKKSIPVEDEMEYDFKPRYDRYDRPVPVTDNHRRYHNLLKDKSKKILRLIQD